MLWWFGRFYFACFAWITLAYGKKHLLPSLPPPWFTSGQYHFGLSLVKCNPECLKNEGPVVSSYSLSWGFNVKREDRATRLAKHSSNAAQKPSKLVSQVLICSD